MVDNMVIFVFRPMALLDCFFMILELGLGLLLCNESDLLLSLSLILKILQFGLIVL